MASITVNRVIPATINAVLVGPNTAQDVAGVLEAATRFGYRSTVLWYADAGSGAPSWMATISKPGYPDQVAFNGYWLVVVNTTVTVYTPQAFINTFTSNIPLVWAATDTAPIAEALPELEAAITFPAPTSANGPFVYTVTVTDETTQTTAEATLSGDPIVSDDQITLTATGLTQDDTYSFTVTVTTQYDGVTATSLSTNTVTATT